MIIRIIVPRSSTAHCPFTAALIATITQQPTQQTGVDQVSVWRHERHGMVQCNGAVSVAAVGWVGHAARRYRRGLRGERLLGRGQPERQADGRAQGLENGMDLVEETRLDDADYEAAS